MFYALKQKNKKTLTDLQLDNTSETVLTVRRQRRWGKTQEDTQDCVVCCLHRGRLRYRLQDWRQSKKVSVSKPRSAFYTHLQLEEWRRYFV